MRSQKLWVDWHSQQLLVVGTCGASVSKLNNYFKNVLKGHIEGIENLEILPQILEEGTIYDYCYNPHMNEWKHWNEIE